MTHYLVQGDTGSQLKSTLVRQDTGYRVDLTDRTIRLYFRQKGTTTPIFSILGTPIDALEGEVLFAFGSNLITISPGFYEGEIEVVNPDTTIESVYEILHFQVRGDF